MRILYHKAKRNRKSTKIVQWNTSEQKLKKKVNKQKKKTRSIKKKALENSKNELRKESKVKRTEHRRNLKIQEKLKYEQSVIRSLSEKLLSWLKPEKIQKIAIATGYLKKLNPKIPPLQFFLTLAFGMFGNGSTTYIMLAANMSTWFEINITAQALFGRISKNETVDFLRSILMNSMSNQVENGFDSRYAKIFQHFTNVYLEDSTQFELNEKVSEGFKGSGGSSSKAAMKLNVVFSITRNIVSHLDVVAGVVSDQTLSKNVRKLIKRGELWIRDLGYFNISDMCTIFKCGGYYLSRLKKGVNVYLNKEDTIPVVIDIFLANATARGKSIDQNVYIGEERHSTRLIGEKVPEEVKHKRIESYKKNKIKRDKNKSMKESYVTWFGYSIFITNAPADKIGTADMVITTYKIRWQIELFFKRIKSLLQIHIIKGESVNRVHCLIFSKLISLLVAQSIMSYAASISHDDEELSEYKVMSWLKDNNRLGNAIAGKGTLLDLFEELIYLYYLLCKNKRNRKSTLEATQEAFCGSATTEKPLEKIA